ncbi:MULTISPECIES: hypothetical protein [Staphylococcus]|uniref:hypothetical protein n=1 Tax=Staphylococcus TaxID=1279 RepID=UPI0008A5B67C|nr:MULTISPECIES: hypothetical protein [Staphylococcus]MCI2907921.1 hypothetical protein [Staphylococcus hominis]OFS42277.1 hypothetical protein HMPREF2881_04585 [Staphylococcus sp. HMSC057A08]
MKILACIEKYLIVITIGLFILLVLIFGLDNNVTNFLKTIIKNKNDILVNIASIFISMYITLALMYPTFINGGGLDKLSKKNYLISFRYIVIGLLCSFTYIINSLLDGILYSSNILNCFLLVLMFISYGRVLFFVMFWLIYDILTTKVKKTENINYNKKIYERLRNIEEKIEDIKNNKS